MGVNNHIVDSEKVLWNLEDAFFKFFDEKFLFGYIDFLVVGHLSDNYWFRAIPINGEYDLGNEGGVWVLDLGKINLRDMCILPHMIEPLLELLKKGKKFMWTEEHAKRMLKLQGHNYLEALTIREGQLYQMVNGCIHWRYQPPLYVFPPPT